MSRIHSFSLCLCSVALLCTLSTPAMAQQQLGGSPAGASGGDAAALSAGTWGLSLGLLGNNPYANNTANISYFFSNQINIGMSVGLRVEDGQDDLSGWGAGTGGGDYGIVIAPMLRYYFPRGHRVTPYFFAKVNLAFSEDPPLEQYFGFEGGLGAEFFAYDYFSLSGAIGMNVNIAEDFGLGLFTSAMMANFYF